MRLHFEEGERDVLTARLGLAADVTDEALTERLANWLQEDPNADREDDDEREDDDDDDIDASAGDVVVVDVNEFRRLRQRDRVAAQIEAAEAIRDRDELIEEAIADGKFGPGRRQHYRERYDSDPDGTRKLIGRLTKNTVPLEARGVEQPTDDEDQSVYPTDWVPEVAARQARQGTSRIHGEE